MRIIKEADFRREIKSAPASAYLFFGEEDYMKNHAISLARESILGDPSMAIFNEIKLDVLTYSAEGFLDILASPPMMSERKLIIITGLNFIAMARDEELDDFLSTLSAVNEYDFNTVIISTTPDKFNEGYLPKRPSEMLRKISEVATPVSFEKNSPQRLAMWAAKHYEHNGVTADAQAAGFTVEYCGRDMYTLAEEIKKISFYVRSKGRDSVSIDDIRLVGVRIAEYDTFTFSNAICAKRRDEALTVLLDMKRKRVDPIMVMGELSAAVCDMVSISMLLSDGLTVNEIAEVLGMNAYKAGIYAASAKNIQNPKRLLSLCREADLDIKSWGDAYRALEKLICTM